jgi:hypothetical protein
VVTKWWTQPAVEAAGCRWRLLTITSRHSGKVLDVANVSRDVGARVFQYDHNGGQNQHWRMQYVRSDQVKIRAKHSGHLLEVNGAGHVVVAADNNSPNQRWIIHPTANGYFNLLHATSNKAIDVSGNNTNNNAEVIVWDLHGGQNQEWRPTSLGNGWFTLTPRHAEPHNKNLDAPKEWGARLILWDRHNQDNQQFRFEY